MISKITDLFSQLRDVHLLYWDMSFKYFDPLVLFAEIIAGMGVNGLVAGLDILNIIKFGALETVVAILGCLFCVVWTPFRENFARISANLICLCFSIACISLLLALVVLLAAEIDPISQPLQDFIGRVIDQFKIFPWETAISVATLLYVLSVFVVLGNTISEVKLSGLTSAIGSKYVFPLLVAVALAWLGTVLAVGPVIAAFPE